MITLARLVDLDVLGDRSQNYVFVRDRLRSKQYVSWSLPMFWAPLERKAWQSASQRFMQELEVHSTLQSKGIPVPLLITESPNRLFLHFQRYEGSNFISYFQNPEVSDEAKLEAMVGAMGILSRIHHSGLAHGDAYFKNFAVKDGDDPVDERLLTYEFEERRTMDDPRVMDVLLFTANAEYRLGRDLPSQRGAALDAAGHFFGDITYRFDARDRFFFRQRFDASEAFFAWFE